MSLGDAERERAIADCRPTPAKPAKGSAAETIDRLHELSGQQPAKPGKGWIIQARAAHHARGGQSSSCRYLSGGMYLFTTFRERAFVFGSLADAAGLITSFPREFATCTSFELLEVDL